MLQGEFFKIISSESVPDAGPNTGTENFRVVVSLDPLHPIYEGHFPQNPVVPGVCQIQMVRESLESIKNIRGRLTSGDNIKFLNMIVPSEHPVLTIELSVRPAVGDCLPFSAVLKDDATVFMKFKGILCIRPS